MTNPAESAPTPPPRSRRGGWLRWALAGSVALNLLLAGLGAGMFARAHMGEGARAFMHGHSFGFGRSGAGSALREQARAAMAARAPAFEAGRKRVAQAWGAVRAAAGSEPLETARLEAALGALRAAQAELARERHAALVSLVEELPPEERARVLGEMGRVFAREGRASWRERSSRDR